MHVVQAHHEAWITGAWISCSCESRLLGSSAHAHVRVRERRTFLINDLARDTFRDLGKKRGEYGSHSSRPHSLKNSISSFLAFLNAIIELPK